MKIALMLCLLLSPLPQVEEKATVYIYNCSFRFFE